MTFKRTTPITALDLDSSDIPDAGPSSKGTVTLNQIESRRMGNRLVVTGDSITAVNCDMAANMWGDSWGTHLALASNGSLQAVYNAAHGSYTSTQIEALFDTEVVAKTPTIVGILIGTNDTLSSGLATTTATNIKSMVAKARAAGADVFLGTLLPQGVAALATPSAPTPTAVATGGTLVAATYRYKVTSLNGAGETVASSAGSAVVSSGTTNSVTVDVTHVEGATSYKIYKETTDGSGTYGLVGTLSGNGPPKRFTDTGSVSPGAAPPGANTTAVAYDTTKQTKVKTINTWLRRYSMLNGIPLVDFHAVLVDATTGMYQTGYTTDGTHPTSTRQRAMGQLAWAALSPRIPKSIPPIAQDNVDPINMISNGCLVNGSASLPTSWASYGGSASGFTDTLAAKTGFAGKALSAARTIPDSRFHDSPNVSTGFSVGDRIQATFVVQVEGSEVGGGQAYFNVNFNGAVGGATLQLIAADVGPCIWTTEFTVPSGATSFYVKGPYLSYGPLTASIGQITFRNLTTLGIVTP